MKGAFCLQLIQYLWLQKILWEWLCHYTNEITLTKATTRFDIYYITCQLDMEEQSNIFTHHKIYHHINAYLISFIGFHRIHFSNWTNLFCCIWHCRHNSVYFTKRNQMNQIPYILLSGLPVLCFDAIKRTSMLSTYKPGGIFDFPHLFTIILYTYVQGVL